MLASPRTQYFTIRSKRIHGMLRWCTYTLLSEPSSHVILNALNLKAFICNRIITAGTVIRFAVSPKRIYSSRTGNVGAESRVHPGKSGLSVLRLQYARARASKLSILIATSFERRSQIQRRDYGDNGTSSLRRIRFLSSAISSSFLPPHVRPHGCATILFSVEISHHKSHGLQSIDCRRLQLVLGPWGRELCIARPGGIEKWNVLHTLFRSSYQPPSRTRR